MHECKEFAIFVSRFFKVRRKIVKSGYLCVLRDRFFIFVIPLGRKK